MTGSLIDFCKLPYTEFISTYCFYQPTYTIETSNLEDYLTDFFDMSEEEIYALVEKFIIKFEDEQAQERKRQFELLTKKKEQAKKLAEARKNLNMLEKRRNNKKTFGTLSRNDYKALEEQIAEAEYVYAQELYKIEAMQLTFSDKFLNKEQLDPVINAFNNRLKYLINTLSTQFVGISLCDPNVFGSEDNEFMKFLKDTEEERTKPNKKTSFKETKAKAVDLAKDIYPKIQKIYSDLFKCINLCTLSEKLLKCISKLNFFKL